MTLEKINLRYGHTSLTEEKKVFLYSPYQWLGLKVKLTKREEQEESTQN